MKKIIRAGHKITRSGGVIGSREDRMANDYQGGDRGSKQRGLSIQDDRPFSNYVVCRAMHRSGGIRPGTELLPWHDRARPCMTVHDHVITVQSEIITVHIV